MIPITCSKRNTLTLQTKRTTNYLFIISEYPIPNWVWVQGPNRIRTIKKSTCHCATDKHWETYFYTFEKKNKTTIAIGFSTKLKGGWSRTSYLPGPSPSHSHHLPPNPFKPHPNPARTQNPVSEGVGWYRAGFPIPGFKQHMISLSLHNHQRILLEKHNNQGPPSGPKIKRNWPQIKCDPFKYKNNVNIPPFCWQLAHQVLCQHSCR